MYMFRSLCVAVHRAYRRGKHRFRDDAADGDLAQTGSGRSSRSTSPNYGSVSEGCSQPLRMSSPRVIGHDVVGGLAEERTDPGPRSRSRFRSRTPLPTDGTATSRPRRRRGRRVLADLRPQGSCRIRVVVIENECAAAAEQHGERVAARADRDLPGLDPVDVRSASSTVLAADPPLRASLPHRRLTRERVRPLLLMKFVGSLVAGIRGRPGSSAPHETTAGARRVPLIIGSRHAAARRAIARLASALPTSGATDPCGAQRRCVSTRMRAQAADGPDHSREAARVRAEPTMAGTRERRPASRVRLEGATSISRVSSHDSTDPDQPRQFDEQQESVIKTDAPAARRDALRALVNAPAHRDGRAQKQ